MSYEVHELKDTTELIEFFKPQSLYLKPISRMNISVALPYLKDPGQSISNWDLMERIKKLISPMQLNSIKVVKNTLEFVRFEADVDNRDIMAKIIIKLDGNSLKIIGFFETFKVRAREAKADFATRHDWDTFFRDAKNMNEMQPGERPDTIYLGHLPAKWFSDLRKRQQETTDDKDKDLPSEFVIRRVFEAFGDIRCIDVPVTDPLRARMTKTGVRMPATATGYGDKLCFEMYVQFVEYISFVRCMDALRNMKLVHVEPTGKTQATCIKVDFDRTKHLSDKNIRRRRLERERLTEFDRLKQAEELARKQAEEQAQAEQAKEKFSRLRQREERRRMKHLERRRLQEAREMEERINREERKLLVAQRKLESIRLLTEVLHRVQMVYAKEEVIKVEQDLVETVTGERRQKEEDDQHVVERSHRERLLGRHEKMLRQKVSREQSARQESRAARRQEQLRARMLVEQRNHELLKQQAVQISSAEEGEDRDDEEALLRQLAMRSQSRSTGNRPSRSAGAAAAGGGGSGARRRAPGVTGRNHPRIQPPSPPVVRSSLRRHTGLESPEYDAYGGGGRSIQPHLLPDVAGPSSSTPQPSPPAKRRFVQGGGQVVTAGASRILVSTAASDQQHNRNAAPSVQIIIEDRRSSRAQPPSQDYACYYEDDDDEYDVLTY